VHPNWRAICLVLAPMKRLFLIVMMTGCTAGVEQQFSLAPGQRATDAPTDMLFELTNHGGNAPEALAFYRVVFAKEQVGGGLYARGDTGDAQLVLASDAGTPGTVDPGDVVRVQERTDGKNFTTADNGAMTWVNVMVVAPDQRTSDALTVTWETVWSSQWQVGQSP
jgi:hypothetical protein